MKGVCDAGLCAGLRTWGRGSEVNGGGGDRCLRVYSRAGVGACFQPGLRRWARLPAILCVIVDVWGYRPGSVRRLGVESESGSFDFDDSALVFDHGDSFCGVFFGGVGGFGGGIFHCAGSDVLCEER